MAMQQVRPQWIEILHNVFSMDFFTISNFSAAAQQPLTKFSDW